VIRLRVLFLIDRAVDHGGAERFAVGLAGALAAKRYELWFCSTREIEPAVADALDRAGVRRLELGRRSKWDAHRFAGLAAVLRRERIDVLHAHMFGSNVWGTIIGRACRVPVVIAHEQTWSYRGEPLRAWLDGHLVGRFATRFVAVSSLDAERMVSVEGVPPEKVVMIPNAYVPRPGALERDLRAELGLDAATPLIGAVSVLRPQKALTVLLEAFSLVLEERPDAHLALAGDGPCRHELRVRARELELDGRVHFSADAATSIRSCAHSMSPRCPRTTREPRWWRLSALPTGRRLSPPRSAVCPTSLPTARPACSFPRVAPMLSPPR